MNENEISSVVVDAAFKIHTKVGPGLLESAYQTFLVYEVKKRGLFVESEVPMPVQYDGVKVDIGYRADLLIEKLVIVELKSVEKVIDIHKKQLLTYLKISDFRLGLLINFNVPLIKDGITRIVNGLEL
ncbi:MAG: GxxExxY protein [Chloroflexi bacterium HGW-Chloroflexi-5]|jgi:GxxExxY protein|nr:MAG: GxxExxY protein [Chloroflexi bacterium HGW-Chloroflexi-5]